MSELEILSENFKRLYNSLKEINTNQNKIKLFQEFYKSYWELMVFYRKALNKFKTSSKNAQIEQIKKLQKHNTKKKMEIDKILFESSNSNAILPFIKQKDKNNPISMWKNLANKIQIEAENQNSKYITNLSSNDINEFSKQFEFYYDLIHKNENPSIEFFSAFYDVYNKLMKELNRIKIPLSKKDIDKIKKGLIAKKENIDILFNNRQPLKTKQNANSITPQNLIINNLNKIVIPHPTQNISMHNLSLNTRLKELELKHKISELNSKELAELKKLKLNEKNKFNKNLSLLVNNFNNLKLQKGTNKIASIRENLFLNKI